MTQANNELITLELRSGNEEELEEVLVQSQPIWGSTISLSDYLDFHSRIRHHPWSEKNFQHLVLVDERGEVLSSCKLYRRAIKVKGRIFLGAGIGAVFTPPRHRGKGFAHQMLASLIDKLKDEGFELAFLFSDIGTEFYERFGFRYIKKKDPEFVFISGKFAPVECRSFDYVPFELISGWYEACYEKARFSVIREPLYWQLLSDRFQWHKNLYSYREQIVVSEKNCSYIWLDLSNREHILLRDFASTSSEPEQVLGGMLEWLYMRIRFKTLTGWLPRDFEKYNFFKLLKLRDRHKTLMMFVELKPDTEIFTLQPEQIQYWLVDYF